MARIWPGKSSSRSRSRKLLEKLGPISSLRKTVNEAVPLVEQFSLPSIPTCFVTLPFTRTFHQRFAERLPEREGRETFLSYTTTVRKSSNRLVHAFSQHQKRNSSSSHPPSIALRIVWSIVIVNVVVGCPPCGAPVGLCGIGAAQAVKRVWKL